MTTTLIKKLTYVDYLQFTPPDSAQYQLIQGELISITSPNARHQGTVRKILKHLERFRTIFR